MIPPISKLSVAHRDRRKLWNCCTVWLGQTQDRVGAARQHVHGSCGPQSWIHSRFVTGLYVEVSGEEDTLCARSWANSLRPRLFMAALPVLVSDERIGLIEFVKLGSCFVRSAKACIANVFTMRLRSLR